MPKEPHNQDASDIVFTQIKYLETKTFTHSMNPTTASVHF